MIKKDFGRKKPRVGIPARKPALKGLMGRMKRTKPVQASGKSAPPPRVGIKMDKKNLMIAAGALALVILLAVAVPPLVRGIAEKKQQGDDSYTVVHATPRPTPTPEPVPPPVIDLSAVAQTVQLESAMNRINEPTPWEEELLYSAGQSTGIDEMIFTKLFTYNMNTKEETEQAETQIKNKSNLPGELYEGRMNDHWIAWLDTNQAGRNILNGKDRLTGETFVIKECALIRPQLRLYGDYVVYLMQESADQDLLYLYNMKSRKALLIDSFIDSTYGTCPPAIYGDTVVWAAPNPDDPSASLLKWLDLSEELDFDAEPVIGGVASPPPDSDDAQTDTATPSQEDTGDSETGDPVDEGGATEEDDPYLNSGGLIQPDKEYGETIDPGSFAIYPVTNGEMIAYLDNLDPANANLMLLRKGGKPVTVAQGVGRVFDIGEDFVVYTQNDTIYLYFWELERYAQLTPEGQKGLLSRSCVNGHTIVWYDANDPNNKGDTVYISKVETPSGALLEY